MTEFTTFVTYGSFESFIKGMSGSFGCPPEVFREVYERHKDKSNGTSEGAYQVVFDYMGELKSMGYERR